MNCPVDCPAISDRMVLESAARSILCRRERSFWELIFLMVKDKTKNKDIRK